LTASRSRLKLIKSQRVLSAMKDIRKIINRDRRLTMYKHCKRAALAYEEEYGLNPSEVIDLGFVLDYTSRLESGSEELFDDWKRQMGVELGMDKQRMGKEAWDCTAFLEYIKLLWQSEKASFYYDSSNIGSTH
jgi:hypothetical protein